MTIAIGSDHAGFALKQTVIKLLEQKGLTYKDFGTYTADSCDYPDCAKPVAEAVADGRYTYGILVCGTGIGMSIAANKISGIRACACSDTFSARATRMHNDANILCFGERVVGPGLAEELVNAFLDTPFEGGRHQQRVDKITALENK